DKSRHGGKDVVALVPDQPQSADERRIERFAQHGQPGKRKEVRDCEHDERRDGERGPELQRKAATPVKDVAATLAVRNGARLHFHCGMQGIAMPAGPKRAVSHQSTNSGSGREGEGSRPRPSSLPLCGKFSFTLPSSSRATSTWPPSTSRPNRSSSDRARRMVSWLRLCIGRERMEGSKPSAAR